jgi:hypothetical protein
MQRPDESVLLVDDEPRVLAALRMRLSDRFSILTAESSAHAIENHEDTRAGGSEYAYRAEAPAARAQPQQQPARE